MNRQTLKSCLGSLHQIRAQVRSKLDPCIIRELDEAIFSLALLLKSDQEVIEVTPKTVYKTLQLLGKIVQCLGWLHELIVQFLE